VETLFDSNLADVPMVYTVAADGKAVSINQMPVLTVVPFGVTCSSDDAVEVTINHELSTPLYLVDAVLGTTTAVSDAQPVNIQPNDYGRYFLTAHDKMESKVREMVDGIVISVRGSIVTVSAKSNISLVRAVNVGGVTVYEQADCGTNTQFQLQQGTYIIEAKDASGKQTAKIIVK